MIWIFLATLSVSAALSVIAWRAWKRRPPSFAEIGRRLEADIAAAEARGVKVDRNDRIAPRKRITF
jgi:hypothetical protein